MKFTKMINVTNPPVGTGAGITVPVGETWNVRTARFVLVTSATVANRQPYITFRHRDDAGSAPYIAGSAFNVPANTTQILSFAADGLSYQAAYTVLVHGFIPDFWLPSGSQVQFNANLLQAGDQISGVALAVERG